jgi:hypothetical protein
MDWPVLKSVRIHARDLALQSLSDFFLGKWSAEEARHLDVAPKLARQGQVTVRPAAKAQSRAFQKIRFGKCAAHSLPLMRKNSRIDAQ